MAQSREPQGQPCRRFPCHPEYSHRPGRKRELMGRRQPLSLFLLVLLVNGLTLVLLGFGAYSRLGKSAENPLQVDLSSPTFKITSAETPAEPEEAMLAAEPEKPAPAKERDFPPPVVEQTRGELPLSPPVPEAGLVPLGPVQPVDLLGSDNNAILVYSSTHNPGDSPMIRNWKMMDLAALVSLAMVSAPVLAQAPAADKDAVDSKTVLKRLDDMDKALTKSFKDMGKDIAEFKKDISALKGDHLTQNLEMDKVTSRVTQLEGQISKLQAELEKMKKRLPAEVASMYTPIDKTGLDEIKTKLGQIEQAVAKIQQAPNRLSLSPAATGRIMLVNLYWEELLFLVNGRTYRVAPNTTMPLEGLSAGTFSYEVISPTWGLRAQNTRVLGPNETFTITAR